MELETGNLILRPFEDSDAPQFVAAARESAKTVGIWMPWWKADYCEAEALHWFETCREGIATKSSYDIGIFLADGESFAGGIAVNGIDAENRIGNVGYWIRESMQNRGICSQAVKRITEFAFDDLGLVRLEIVILAENMPSRRVAEKCGAQLECIAQNRLFHDGRPMAAAVYALLRA
ncbi:MAG: GNAT family N-acetyltransferase [Gammaproteobacteria bacterium]